MSRYKNARLHTARFCVNNRTFILCGLQIRACLFLLGLKERDGAKKRKCKNGIFQIRLFLKYSFVFIFFYFVFMCLCFLLFLCAIANSHCFCLTKKLFFFLRCQNALILFFFVLFLFLAEFKTIFCFASVSANLYEHNKCGS